LQSEEGCSVTQPRITFVPTAEEIAEVALWHMKNVSDPVVSFGQGCEGEPLLVGHRIKEAIQIIRTHTKKGIINLNTNASKPEMIRKLFEAGLDSIRVSLNSVQKDYYDRYYRPNRYTFFDVCESVQIAKKMGKWVSINYLCMPGFTERTDEIAALRKFIKKYKIDMIQWRNLNYDPNAYFKRLKVIGSAEKAYRSLTEHIKAIHKEFPLLMKGYFNPSKNRINRHKKSITK
jgi:MoaA/NifB/PqqE/SkfB family radical SAM enzyme